MNCKHCKKPIEQPKKQGRRRLYCDDVCRMRAVRKRIKSVRLSFNEQDPNNNEQKDVTLTPSPCVRKVVNAQDKRVNAQTPCNAKRMTIDEWAAIAGVELPPNWHLMSGMDKRVYYNKQGVPFQG